MQTPKCPNSSVAGEMGARAATGVIIFLFVTRSESGEKMDVINTIEPDTEILEPEEKKQKRVRWSEDEDELLMDAITLHGTKSWKVIAQHVVTRDPSQCLQRWVKSLNPQIVKGRWTPAEDKQLLDFIRPYFPNNIRMVNWKNISSCIDPPRTSKQCRERWFNHLDPSLKPCGSWSPEEDKNLLMLVEIHGTKWAEVARLLTGRSENAVKVRYKSLTRSSDDNSLVGGVGNPSYKVDTMTYFQELDQPPMDKATYDALNRVELLEALMEANRRLLQQQVILQRPFVVNNQQGTDFQF